MTELFDKNCDIVLQLETFRKRWHSFTAFENRFIFQEYILSLWLQKRTIKASFYIFMTKVRTQRHINQEKVRKRTKSFFKKMNELTQIANAKIYFVMNRNERYQIYKLIDQLKWSSSKQEMINRSITKIHALFNSMILEEALSHFKI